MDPEVRGGGPGVRIVCVHGALDGCAVHAFQRTVRGELDDYPVLLVIDLCATTAVDRAGVAALERMARDARLRDVDLCLSGGERVRMLLGPVIENFMCD